MGILVKEELCEVVEVRRRCDRVMAIGLVFEGFEGIHGGYGIGKRNAEGRLLLDF